ncbi:MAG TPA: O-GlcNAc transferase [Elusimicrobia bacterium]|nr:O-GlcNAc transferase [Elusimicrobiota bacterium]
MSANQKRQNRHINTPKKIAPLGGNNFPRRTIPAWPWLAAASLLVITVLAYLPAIRTGGFIWDDDAYVTGNLLLRSLQGLHDIWSKVGGLRGGTLQYYPLTFSVLWAEYHLFELQPLGYHLLNVLLHALNAVLVWQILRRLCVPGALMAAAVFAIHPVCVESVAWVTELKNVLSGLFYLSALLCYLRFLNVWGPEPQPAGPTSSRNAVLNTAPAEVSNRYWPFYFLSIFLFLCALASKTVTASLPAVILLIIWWKTGRVGWKNILLTVPMFILGAGSGLLTSHLEKTIGASGNEWFLLPVEHLLLAGRILWFYAGKLIWPGELIFIYPRWEVSQAVWWQYLFPLAAIALIAALWMARKKIGRGPLTATLFFAGTLVPVLGFLNVYPMRYSYVADHFQYLASLGPIALLAAGAARICLRPGAGLAKPAISAAGMILLTLGWLTWRQSGIYKNADQIWIDTIKKNPSCWMAHNNFGLSLAGQGREQEAEVHYQEAVRIKPDFAEVHNNYGIILVAQGKVEEAITHYREAVRLNADMADAHGNWGSALGGQGKTEEAAAHYHEALRLKPDFPDVHNNLGFILAGKGKTEEAITHYREALRVKPELAEAHGNLGSALAGQGKVEEAITHYREALRLKPNLANAHNALGIALVTLGRHAEAIQHFRDALQIAPNHADAERNLRIVSNLNRNGR